MKKLTISLLFLALILGFFHGCTQQTKVTPEEAKAIAEETYIFAYPMLDNYKMMFAQAVYDKSPAYEAPFNKMKHKSILLGPEYTTIVRPNNDTFYSIVWMDLRSEPMIIQVPAIQEKRYYSFQLIDLYTHNFAYIGTRATGFDAGTYMIAGPDWDGKKPEKVKEVFQTEGNFAVALGRTQVYGPDDADAAKAVQNGHKAMPLSHFIGSEAPAPAAKLNFPVWNPEQFKSAGFIGYLNFLLGQVKLHPSETALLEKFSKIDIGPDKAFDPEQVAPDILKAINEGVASALVKIEEETKKLGKMNNGWMQVSGAFGTREAMQGKYLTRAAGAMFGLWGNTLEEAFYPETSMDADGETFDGSKHNYILHFEADEIPPVKAFWSLSMYKLPEQLFIENPINRYIIGSATEGLKYEDDGALNIYIQRESPGKDKESNWLPAHNGPFSLQARLYWPSPEKLDPLYVMPVVRKAVQAHELSRYMGGEVELVTAPNGALVNAEVLEVSPKISYLEPTTEKVADGVWCIGGYSLANTTVIEGDDGLIVYDTGDTREEAEHIRKAIEKISDKPVKVIIYSHSHYAMGAGALVDNPKDVLVVGHPKVNETVESSLKGGGAPSAIPEVGPILTARTISHFGLLLPEKGPDAGVAPKLDMGKPIAFLPATKTVENGEELEVLGIKLQFFTEYMSDDYNLTVWVPEKKAVLNNFLWPGTPNLYTLRGGVYRSPLVWRDGLKVIRDLQPEILLNTHTRAVVGKEKVMKTLIAYMDQISITYDQTLRGIMRGMGPDELRHFVNIPSYLSETPENFQGYGESVHFPEAIYQYVIGWFDWDSTKLFKIAPVDAAEKTITLMGGREKVVKATRAALDKQEFAWAAELIQYVYLLDPMDKEVRQLKADILRQIGHRTTGSIARGFLLTEALALEGKIDSPLTVMPSAEIVASSPTTFVDFYRIRIDVEKSKAADKVIEFVFNDKNNKSVALHVRRGVAEFVPEPSTYLKKADYVLNLDAKTWATIYLGNSDITKEIQSKNVKLTKGNKVELASIFDMFDKFDPAKNSKVPPLEN